jgi:hypothetical protein
VKQITHSAREQLKKRAERALCTSALERIGARPMRYARMPRCGDSGVTRRDSRDRGPTAAALATRHSPSTTGQSNERGAPARRYFRCVGNDRLLDDIGIRQTVPFSRCRTATAESQTSARKNRSPSSPNRPSKCATPAVRFRPAGVVLIGDGSRSAY